jgi:hypothetical protein
MGWMRTIFLGDIGNRLDIGDAEENISVLRRRIHMSDDREGLVTEADLRSIAALEDRSE